MMWQDGALVLAGIVGGATAIVHGVLTQKLMIKPVAALTNGRVSKPVARLVPVLLQFSTYNWLLGGLALIAAALWAGPEIKLATGVLVASSYLFGAIGNFWGTSGRHPGWMLMAVALVLIGVGLAGG